MEEILIQARGLKKYFGQVHAVDGIDLAVKSGEIYGLVGSDGAGKTTTLRLLVGVLRADAGQASICGYDIGRQTESAHAMLGYLSQRFSLYEDLTVLENIRFFTEVRGLKAGEWLPRCLEILDFVGLGGFKDRLAGQLSGGMKQKLGLATALAARPRVLLLDEPTTGVDPVTRQDFWQLIIRLVSQPHNGEGVSVLITTPYMDEAARCNRVGFMRQGKLVREGPPGQLRSSLEGRVLELRGDPLPELRRIAARDPGVVGVQAFGDRLHLHLKDPQSQAVIQRLKKAVPAGGARLTEARLIPPSLEDAFIALSTQD